ncbi:MAG TPA: hypothetical protein VEG44_03180 [Candidatus Acidoferrales bacterium]|nr:hypothetical protein [Candidatus Acidoferrales bacterium]
MAITLNAVEETLFIPLSCLAHVSMKYPSLFHDPKAIDLVEAIESETGASNVELAPMYSLIGCEQDQELDMLKDLVI